jgi:hypothetical protein
MCTFCGKEFQEEQAQKGCAACALTKGCQMLRCPHCGYETPREPAWVKRVKSWRKRKWS